MFLVQFCSVVLLVSTGDRFKVRVSNLVIAPNVPCTPMSLLGIPGGVLVHRSLGSVGSRSYSEFPRRRVGPFCLAPSPLDPDGVGVGDDTPDFRF